MYPPRFEYFDPTTLDEAINLLAQYKDEAKLLAGGQSLIPMMKLRLASPLYLIDLNRIKDLDYLREDGGALRVGALVRHKAVERSDLVRRRYPAMAAAAPQIADPIVRNLGTLVGSVCHADPQGDWASVMLAMNAEVVARGRRGERRIPIGEFLTGPFATTLQPDEIATEVRVPDPGRRAFGTYLKLERKVGDFATVGVAVHLSLDGDKVTRAGVGLTGVGPINIQATEAQKVLVGNRLDDKVIAEAARRAAAAADPTDDIRGSAEYKREVVRVFVNRALRQAMAAKAA